MERPVRLLGLLTAALVLGAALPAGSQDVKAGRVKSAVCVGCHGPKGMAANPSFPTIDGLGAGYLYRQLEAYQQMRRDDLSMRLMVSILSQEDIVNLAAFYATQRFAARNFKTDAARGVRGRAKSADLRCADCHGRGLAGSGDIPRLAGQSPAYLVKQLQAFREGTREHLPGGADAMELLDSDIEDLGHYMAALR